MVRLFDRRWLAALAGLACVVAGFALLSGSSRAATKKSCSGSAAPFSVVTNLSNTVAGAEVSKDVVAGFRAAAAAINKSCELGRPLKIVACDDKFTPTGAASCGREAVAAKVFGVAAYSASGDSYSAPVTAANIPIFPYTASSASESSSKLSYPFGDPIPIVLSLVNAAKASGSKRLALFHLDAPGIAFFIDLIKKQAGRLGVQIAADVPIPVTASDMSTYVAQALNAKPTSAFCVVAPATNAAIFKQIVAQGKNPKTFSLISSQNGMTPAVLATMPKSVTNGMTIVGWNLNPKSPSDSGKPVVKQYLRELKAAKQSLGTRIVTANGFGAWAEMHVIADALKAKGLAPTTANVQRAMITSKMPALMQKYGHLPRDFSKPAFPNDPVLKNLRIFSSTSYYYRLNAKQQPIALVSKPVSINKTPKFAK